MVVSIAPWSIVLTPGKTEVIVPPADLQIKNAALPDELRHESARTSVKLTYQSLSSHDDEDEDEDDDDDDDEPPTLETTVTTVLCSLTPGKIEQSTCEIILEQDTEYILEIAGKNPIHLYGNYIDQDPVDQPPYGSDLDSDEDDEEDEEEAYNLNEVSSDVEVEIGGDEAALDDEDEDAARFEEIQDEEEPPKSLKRPRDEEMEVDEHEEKLSKSQRKKLAKKLKAADGEAVPAPAPEKKVEETKEEEKEKKKKEKKKKDKAEKKEKPEKKDGEKKEKADKKAERTLDGGVKVRDAKVGTGKTAKKGDRVEMRYIGKFLDGKVFDKNTTGKPFVFKLGQGDVIKGWDIGVAGMQIGGEREIVVPPSMGYGNRKMGDIPSGSTLKFEVKLLEIK